MNLYVSKLQESSGLNPKKQQGLLDLLPLELVNLQFYVVNLFRDTLLRQKVTVVDFSDNNFDQLTLFRVIDLLHACSHRLKILKFSGNFMTAKALRELTNVLETTGIKGIERLELKNCQVACKCT